LTSGIRHRLRVRTLLLAILLPALLTGTAVVPLHADEILPFREVRVGMKGEGRTVFSGTEVSRFEAEVIGLLENVGPQRNLILVRLGGAPLERTGVMEGMSGSPIYVNGRVIGALAYSWEFSKEPIAGVTPIEEMLDAARRSGGTPGRSRPAAAIPGSSPLSALHDPARIVHHFGDYFRSAVPEGIRAASLAPIGVPLSLSGFPAHLADRLGADIGRAGLVPFQAGSAGSEPGAGGPLVPGSAVAAKLVKGDVEVSAVGTVTYRDGERVLAFGHPLLNLGPTSLPMSAAVVQTLFPSLASSFKVASPAKEELGVIEQDRSVGISGSLGGASRLIPIRLKLSSKGGKSQWFAFDVVEDSFLSPYLIYYAINAVLASSQKSYGDATVKVMEGSVMKVAGEQDVELANLYSGPLSPFYASGTVAYIAQLILNNEYSASRIQGINLTMEYSDELRTARIERVWCEKDRVRPGERVALTVTLQPFRGGEITRVFHLTIPEELTPGRVTLQVGDGSTVSRREEEGAKELRPRDLSQLIWLINHIRTNDRLYVILTRPDNGILFQGARMPDLPPSKALVMLRPQTEGNFHRVAFRGISEDSIPTDFAVEGYKLFSLEVEE
jgi:hypothetical protein